MSAGIDATAEFIACTFGEKAIKNVTAAMEYVINPQFPDPYAVWPNGTYKYYRY